MSSRARYAKSMVEARRKNVSNLPATPLHMSRKEARARVEPRANENETNATADDQAASPENSGTNAVAGPEYAEKERRPGDEHPRRAERTTNSKKRRRELGSVKQNSQVT